MILIKKIWDTVDEVLLLKVWSVLGLSQQVKTGSISGPT